LSMTMSLTMNASFYRTLTSIAWIEKDFPFHSPKCFQISDLSFPHHLLVVSKEDNIPQLHPNQMNVETLTEALLRCNVLNRMNKIFEFSILLMDVVYIDGLDVFHKEIQIPKFGKGTHIEIIGADDVRFLLFAPGFCCIDGLTITFKNITIHRRSPLLSIPLFIIRNGARMRLENVRVSSPECAAFVVTDQGSCLEADNCRLRDCDSGFLGFEGGILSFNHCHFSRRSKSLLKGNKRIFIFTNTDNTVHGSDKTYDTWQMKYGIAKTDISLKLRKCEFDKVGTIFLQMNCKLQAESNVYIGRGDHEELIEGIMNSVYPSIDGVHCCDGILASITGDTFVNLLNAVGLFGHATDASLNQCEFKPDVESAFTIFSNPKLKVFNSKIWSMHLLSVESNCNRAQLEFRRNSTRGRPCIQLFNGSEGQTSDKNFLHDFEDVHIKKIPYFSIPQKPSCKAQSTKRKELSKTNNILELPKRPFDAKECAKCQYFGAMNVADSDNLPKMRYCGKCKKVCYCSKECQEADWKDHKVVCKDYARNTKFGFD